MYNNKRYSTVMPSVPFCCARAGSVPIHATFTTRCNVTGKSCVTRASLPQLNLQTVC